MAYHSGHFTGSTVQQSFSEELLQNLDVAGEIQLGGMISGLRPARSSTISRVPSSTSLGQLNLPPELLLLALQYLDFPSLSRLSPLPRKPSRKGSRRDPPRLQSGHEIPDGEIAEDRDAVLTDACRLRLEKGSLKHVRTCEGVRRLLERRKITE